MRAANDKNTKRSRNLRRAATNAETALWYQLRARRLSGFKFVRQEPIGHYVVDLVCRESRLSVEVDGGQHADNRRDEIRDRWLADHNYRVLRFWNNDVLGNMSGVLEMIAAALAGGPPHPDRQGDPTSPRRRGEVREKVAVRRARNKPGSTQASTLGLVLP
jgi:very-short-patch-repair endonuclease